MKTTQTFAVSAMAAAVLLALAGCGGMSTRDADDAIAAAPAQGALPQCENSNYDPARGIFTIINPAPGTVNQQCLLTVHSAQAAAAGSQYPAPYLVEGRYDILYSGGGGGGAGGEYWNQGGGSGGGGAAPGRTVQYLSPGVYKLTIGTGGEGAMPGRSTYNGNETSLTNYNTGELIAGFQGADIAKQTMRAPEVLGHGGEAVPGGSRGGDGGDAGAKNSESAAQAGGASQTAGYAGAPGQAGTERAGRSDDGRGPQANAGGGGGASVGSGGTGESRDGASAGGFGDLGGGGAGGRGGFFTADPGGRGGHGYMQLALSEPAPRVVAAAPVMAPTPAPEAAPAAAATVTTPAPVAARPARKDRN